MFKVIHILYEYAKSCNKRSVLVLLCRGLRVLKVLSNED